MQKSLLWEGFKLLRRAFNQAIGQVFVKYCSSPLAVFQQLTLCWLAVLGIMVIVDVIGKTYPILMVCNAAYKYHDTLYGHLIEEMEYSRYQIIIVV